MKPLDWFHPITRRRLQRFWAIRRARGSFVLLACAYAASLVAELWVNQAPLHMRFEGRHYFPVFRFYSERAVTGAGPETRLDFKALAASERFRADPANRALWPPVPHGPLEIIRPERIGLPDEVVVRLAPEARIASVNLTPDWRVTRGVAAGYFFGGADGAEEGAAWAAHWPADGALRAAVERRFRNEAAPEAVLDLRGASGWEAEVSMPPFTPRASPPRTVRVTLREKAPPRDAIQWRIARDGNAAAGEWPEIWAHFSESVRAEILAHAARRFDRFVEPLVIEHGGRPYRVRFEREEIRYPFRPVAGHPLGLDAAGRDVLARLVYGFRTSMTFGVILVFASLAVGTMIGAAQGYHGGRIDLVGQRAIEVWDALPFLYILILMGSIYGRSFALLLLCYAAFNWIGISYYMRAEFLRLRRWPFVEAARAQGLPAWRVMFRHILPNALVPLVTFFPFSLVSAIGTLAALDFLGFGLPPPIPSWGELLAQAQEYPWAWWLTLYPSLALFAVMLLGVFVGEGVRQAFDPKPYSRIE